MVTRMRWPATRPAHLSSIPTAALNPTFNAPWRRFASGKSKSNPSSHWFRNSFGFAVAGTVAYFGYTYVNGDWEAWIERQNEVKKEVIDVNDLRADFIQETRSLKSPGAYTWGSNAYKVVAPESKDSDVKTPRRFKYFTGQVLRDFKIDEKSGAAITENGDLVQWGKGYSETEFKPTKTLVGKNLASLALSESRIIALSSDGNIYSLPISKQDQSIGPKLKESSWLPFWGSQSTLSYRLLRPSLKLGERVTSIQSGLEHVVLLTSSGRVFTAAASTEHYPSLGQFGVPGLSFSTRPSGPVDTCHEVTTLGGSKITQIASGDYHSLALSKDGRLFAWGDNSFGQLGVEFLPEHPFNDTPSVLSLKRLYRLSTVSPKVTNIAAGGANTFFTVDSTRILGPDEQKAEVRDLGRITADTWACGRGVWGTLGAGKWIHLQDSPIKVKDLSGLGEYDEKMRQMLPIRIRAISVGTTHVAALLDNKTNLSARNTDALDNSNDWGYEAFWWGGNENFQLGTGKRANLAKPAYIKAPSESPKNPEPEARLQIMPRHKGKVGKRNVNMEQRIECGRHVSAIFSAV